jgi:lipopolysaccharide/colanic/teichoic acid biosynthesis glycosyltransferase
MRTALADRTSRAVEAGDARSRDLPLAPAREPVFKRPFDFLLALTGIILSAPLWLAIAVAIKFEDAGPILYIQERWGRNRKGFMAYKFRSMVAEADAQWGSLQATEDDPRITRIGKLLRATALDEMPQLLNILKGDMSFVGPRALPINEVQVREEGDSLPDQEIPGFDERLRVRPGLTGITQIYAPRDVPRKEKFEYDLVYTRKQSLLFDLKLIALSFLITFRGKWEVREKKI